MSDTPENAPIEEIPPQFCGPNKILTPGPPPPGWLSPLLRPMDGWLKEHNDKVLGLLPADPEKIKARNAALIKYSREKNPKDKMYRKDLYGDLEQDGEGGDTADSRRAPTAQEKQGVKMEDVPELPVLPTSLLTPLNVATPTASQPVPPSSPRRPPPHQTCPPSTAPPQSRSSPQPSTNFGADTITSYPPPQEKILGGVIIPHKRTAPCGG